MKPPRSKQEAEAPTVVFWDMCRCPVPLGVDPLQVGPCIERFLKYLGFRGRLIITAVGILTDVPKSVLQKVSSTGIFLHHADDSYRSMKRLLYSLSCDVNPPANIMVISTPPSYSDKLTLLHEKDGFNVIYPFSYEVPQEPSSINSLWRNFLMEDSWPPREEVQCSRTGEWWHNNVTYPVSDLDSFSSGSRWRFLLRADSWPPLKEGTTGEWVCMVCKDQGGLGAGRLINHLSSREHAHELLEILSPCRCKDLWCKHGLDPMAETPLYYYPDTVVWTGDVSLMIKKKEPENESLRRSEMETMQSEKDKAMEEALALRREMETMRSKNKAMEEALAKLGSMTEKGDTSGKSAEKAKEQEAELRRLKVQCDQWRKAAEVASDMLAGGSNNNNSNGKYIERTGSREPLLKRRNVKVSPYMYETDDELSLPKKKKGSMLTDDELSLPKKKKGSMLKKICVGY